MTTRSLLSVTFLLLATVPALGCGAAADPIDAASEEETTRTRAAIELVDGGPVQLLGEAFGDVPLDKVQRAEIEELAEDTIERHATTRAAMAKLASAFADQIEKGTLDRAALDALLDEAKKAREANRPKDVESLDKLHALLDKDQRDALADAIEDRVKERFGGRRERMGELGEKLQLSDDQRSEIKSLVMSKVKQGGFGAMREKMKQRKEALGSFREDDFDAGAVLAGAGEGDKRAMVLDIAEAVLPKLSAEQRKLAAELLRERASELLD